MCAATSTEQHRRWRIISLCAFLITFSSISFWISSIVGTVFSRDRSTPWTRQQCGFSWAPQIHQTVAHIRSSPASYRLSRSCAHQSVSVPERVTNGSARSMVSSVSSVMQLPGPRPFCGEPAPTSRSSWSTFTPPVQDTWDTCWTKDPPWKRGFERGQRETGSNRHSCRAFGPQSRHCHSRQRARHL